MRTDPIPIALPLAHVGSVNAWLLPGEPVTLVDTGPRNEHALRALEEGLRRQRVRIEDLELVLLTHHHVDHVGLAATIARRSGATVAGIAPLADYVERYDREVEEDRRFSHALMHHHGVPEDAVAGDGPFWDFLRESAEPFPVTSRLEDSDRVQAGDRMLRVVARPGHSTTDTLFVDDRAALAFTGDHLLSRISSNTEIASPERSADGRARSRVRYLDGLRLTADMPVRRLLTGHGAPVVAPARLVRARLLEHRRRCERILAVLEGGRTSAYGIARHLWRPRTVAEQPLLVVWEVLGHLELLLAAGRVAERAAEPGSLFELARHGRTARPSAERRHRRRRADRARVRQG
jgi:glyoxylase-like metal-dependent hydrolase (beta-lactamase superfamily II)